MATACNGWHQHRQHILALAVYLDGRVIQEHQVIPVLALQVTRDIQVLADSLALLDLAAVVDLNKHFF